MGAIGVELNYQVYSQNHAMNVTTRYAQNRRMYLDGNFRIYTRGLPELELINFDVINNRIDTTAEELKNFHLMLLQRVVKFAKEIGIYKVRYYAFQYNCEERVCVSPKQNMEICKKLGFEISSKHNTTDYQADFVRIITHPNIS
ncbi:MAG TPA: hypothetical protein H9875_01075 [Candidatus Levilactobacillus faecigallinarum]|uniref:Uncharacterized protein n=1 Tax=Candidatus Levilactobacillus faecigallinarum TaxID=2838638 RepID=A0A9D1QRC4_9LACO|nr:hypothetical protein [Candidatus Levilactobacillus faecigallinarum]